VANMIQPEVLAEQNSRCSRHRHLSEVAER
jgi:hypothetical protein